MFSKPKMSGGDKNHLHRAGTSSDYRGEQSTSSAQSPRHMMHRVGLQNLVRDLDPYAVLDEDVEEVLQQMADDFIDAVLTGSCMLAKHRRASTVGVTDVKLYLERNWNMWVDAEAPVEKPTVPVSDKPTKEQKRVFNRMGKANKKDAKKIKKTHGNQL